MEKSIFMPELYRCVLIGCLLKKPFDCSRCPLISLPAQFYVFLPVFKALLQEYFSGFRYLLTTLK